jgi:hypothetical protein
MHVARKRDVTAVGRAVSIAQGKLPVEDPVAGLRQVVDVLPAELRPAPVDDVMVLEEQRVVVGTEEVPSTEVHQGIREYADDLATDVSAAKSGHDLRAQ